MNSWFYTRAISTTKTNIMHRLIILFTLFALLSCKEEKKTQSEIIQEPKKVETGINQTIETFMILRSIANNDPLFQYRDSTYKGKPIMYEARKTFVAYKNHPAVVATQNMLNVTSSTGDLILQGLLYFEEFPSKNQKFEITSDHWKNRKDSLINYVYILHQFYMDAKVSEFISNQSVFYNGAIEEAKSYINDDLIETMENYFGIVNQAYKMILIPNSPFGMGFGVKTNSDMGGQFYQIISPANDVEWNENSTYKTYGFAGEGANDYYRDLVVHEFCHPFITPFIESEKWRTEIAKTDSLFIPKLDSIMSTQSYGSWWGFVNEHIVRVAEIRIAKEMGEQSLEEMRYTNIEKSGFILIPEAEKLMEEYENNRDKYSNIELFIPKLIGQLNKYSKDEMNKKLQLLTMNKN